MKDSNINVLKKAIEIHGEEAQLLVAMEECAELIQAISHHLRKRNPTNIIEEIADVSIMIKQLEIIFGKDDIKAMIDSKIKRLNDRLSKTKGVI